MKRKYVLICMMTIMPFALLFSQYRYAFEDAVELRNQLDETDHFVSDPNTGENKYIAIIAAYTNFKYHNDDELISHLGGNKFFAGLLPASAAKGGKIPRTPAQSSSGILNTLGGLNVTQLADGLAKFLAERTKEELETAFFSKLKKALEDSEDFKKLLPRTTGTLKLIGEKVYDFKKYVNMLREAFYGDLKALPADIPTWLDTSGTIGNGFDTKTKAILKVACIVVGNLLKKSHPGDLLSELAEEKNAPILKDIGNSDLVSAVRLLDIISQSIRSRDIGQYWISMDMIESSDPLVWQIYCGLLYESSLKQPESFTLSSSSTLTLTSTLDNIGTHLNDLSEIINVVKSMVKTTESIKIAVKNLQDADPSQLDVSAISDLVEAFSGLLEKTGEVSTILKRDLHVTNPFLDIVGDFGQIASDIHQKHYSAGIADFALLINKLSSGSQPEFVAKILEYGGFLALLAEAQSSDDVQSAIEIYALPAGSSRIKKESNVNIALQAYVGGFFQVQQDVSDLTLLNGWVGFTAPVGISFSKGFPLFKSRSSLSVFGSAVDVGSLVQFRLVNSTDTVKKNISLANIFSPGVGLVWGIPKLPLSLGATYSAGPLLSKIVDDGKNIQVANNQKWGVRLFIAVDIPILNFYNVSRKAEKD